MSRTRYSSGPSGADSYHDRPHQYDRYHTPHDDVLNDGDNLPRCPCESPHKQVFTVSHLLIVHSEDLERLLAWLPMADGDVHANPGKYFEEFWPTWTQECVLKQIEGPKNDHGFAFEVSAPGFPIRVRGNNSQIRQAQATAVLHFMLALVSGQHDTSRLPANVQARLATLPRKRPAVPSWISVDLHEVRVHDEDTEYSREYLSRKYPRPVAQFTEMQMDPTNHFSSPRKILDELGIDFPYFTYRKLRSGFWRAYAIHRKVTVCGDALYVADARAVAVLHLLVLAARGLVSSNLDLKRSYALCMRPDTGFRNRGKNFDLYKPDQGQHQNQRQHARLRSRSRSRSPPGSRRSRSSADPSRSETNRTSARGRPRSRTRSPPPVKQNQTRHVRASRSPWRWRRSNSRSPSRKPAPPAGTHNRRRRPPSPDEKYKSRRHSVTEAAKPISQIAEVAESTDMAAQAQVLTPVSNQTPSIGGSPHAMPGAIPAAIATPAALPFAALPTYSTPEAAYAAIAALQRQVDQLTSSVSQALQLVQPLYTRQQQQLLQYQQYQQQQAMLATMAPGSPTLGFAMSPQQLQGQATHVAQQQPRANEATQQQLAVQYPWPQQQPSHNAPPATAQVSSAQHQPQPASATSGPELGSSEPASASGVDASPRMHSLYGQWLNR